MALLKDISKQLSRGTGGKKDLYRKSAGVKSAGQKESLLDDWLQAKDSRIDELSLQASKDGIKRHESNIQKWNQADNQRNSLLSQQQVSTSSPMDNKTIDVARAENRARNARQQHINQYQGHMPSIVESAEREAHVYNRARNDLYDKKNTRSMDYHLKRQNEVEDARDATGFYNRPSRQERVSANVKERRQASREEVAADYEAKQKRRQQAFNQRTNAVNRVKERVNGIDGVDMDVSDIEKLYNKSMGSEAFRQGDFTHKVGAITDGLVAKGVGETAGTRAGREATKNIQNQIKQNIENAKSGKAVGSRPSATSEIDMKGLSKGERHSLDREMRKQDFFNNNTGNLTEESVKAKLMKDFDLDDAGYDKFTKNTNGYRENLFNQRRGDAVKNVSMMDNMMGNKVPHMAGGALLTAGLVNSMSSSRGQQSNASLYGQSQPYY